MSAYIDLLKATRAEIVRLLKREGAMCVDNLADCLSISKVAVRRHLDQLEEQALVTHQSERCERGRPRYVFSLTPDGDRLFPDTSADFACELLAQVEESLGEEAIGSLLTSQASCLITSIRENIDEESLEAKVSALSKRFNDRGYLTEMGRLPEGGFKVIEHNCPIRDVASRYPRICLEELRVYREVTGASVECLCRIADGSNACEYRISEEKPNGRTGRNADASHVGGGKSV